MRHKRVSMHKKSAHYTSFPDALKNLLEIREDLTIEEILSILSGHGYAALLLIFTLPLCLPIPLLGLSTPFGLFLCLLGIQMGYTKHIWLPKRILKKKIPKKTLEKIVKKIISISLVLQRFLKSRLSFLVKKSLFIKINGTVIALLSLLLALPLPIPLTNFLAGIPIVCLALGFLEDDGVFVLIGYFLALVCFTVFSSLAYVGVNGIEHLAK